MSFIAERYILRLFLTYLIGCSFVFNTLYLAIDVVPLLSRYDVSFETLVLYYKYFLPEIIYHTTPASCIISSLLTLSHFNKTKELTAFFSLGMSYFRVCLPILIFLCFISFLSLWWSDNILPISSQKKDYIYFVEIKKNPSLYSSVSANKIWYRSSHIIFNIQTLNLKQSKAEGLSLYYFNKDGSLAQLTRAKEVKMKGSTWTLLSGRSTIFVPESDFPLTKAFAKKVLTVDEDLGDLQAGSQPVKNMNLKQMKRFIEKNKESGLDTLQFEVEYHRKLSFAFTAFITSFLGMSFGFSTLRRRLKTEKNLFSIEYPIISSSLYWVLFISFINLGENGMLPPLVSAWSANIPATALGAFFFSK